MLSTFITFGRTNFRAAYSVSIFKVNFHANDKISDVAIFLNPWTEFEFKMKRILNIITKTENSTFLCPLTVKKFN